MWLLFVFSSQSVCFLMGILLLFLYFSSKLYFFFIMCLTYVYINTSLFYNKLHKIYIFVFILTTLFIYYNQLWLFLYNNKNEYLFSNTTFPDANNRGSPVPLWIAPPPQVATHIMCFHLSTHTCTHTHRHRSLH